MTNIIDLFTGKPLTDEEIKTRLEKQFREECNNQWDNNMSKRKHRGSRNKHSGGMSYPSKDDLFDKDA